MRIQMGLTKSSARALGCCATLPSFLGIPTNRKPVQVGRATPCAPLLVARYASRIRRLNPPDVAPTLNGMGKTKIPATGEGYPGEIMGLLLSRAVGAVENVTFVPSLLAAADHASCRMEPRKKGRPSDFRELQRQRTGAKSPRVSFYANFNNHTNRKTGKGSGASPGESQAGKILVRKGGRIYLRNSVPAEFRCIRPHLHSPHPPERLLVEQGQRAECVGITPLLGGLPPSGSMQIVFPNP